MLDIPTVLARFIQQLLLQVMTPIFDPGFSEHSYGFRPGRSAHDAMRAAQQYAQAGKDWVVDLDTARAVVWDGDRAQSRSLDPISTGRFVTGSRAGSPGRPLGRSDCKTAPTRFAP